ncbi:collagen alpha-5(vi) chain [Plakobranchus ocellatus]|uniref:Collagen alpha-5(Vi) chain n=1 Tax=Plakobranchus ocellatus TaxID=259542 RepID=A0AAV3YNM7_9GAST|nr:collagen alpha-5(vi) chain [Plakobranchus ocellatus]
MVYREKSTGDYMSLLNALDGEDGVIEDCVHAPIELAFVLDSSSSIYPPDFETAKEFIQDFIKEYEIGPEHVRVSIITYGLGIYPEDGFNLTTFTDSIEIIEAIGNIPFRSGLYTATGEAIDYMRTVQLADDVVRPGADKVCIVITDGTSQEPDVTKIAAGEALGAQITMFAVGVGDRVNTDELINIAGGNESRTTRVDNYDKLKTIRESLLKETCTERLPPMIQSCGVTHPSDVVFVFDPTSLGLDFTAWTTSFISATISADDMEDGFQYGVVSGSCPDDAGFSLDAYSKVGDIKERLLYYDQSNLPNLVETLAIRGFTEEFGARSEAKKVAVIVTMTGQKDIVQRLELPVDGLMEQGVRVFIADPSGVSKQVGDAETLFSGSSNEVAEDLISKLCYT